MANGNDTLPSWMGVSLKKYWSEKARTLSYDNFIFEYAEKMIIRNRGIHWEFIQFLGLNSKTHIDTLYFNWV
jgi:hypothetical protein